MFGGVDLDGGFNPQEELARRQRHRMLQTGLLLCFLLLMLDYRTSPPQSTGSRSRVSAASGRTATPISIQSLSQLKTVLAAGSGLPNVSFPGNASGHYKGNWQRMEQSQVHAIVPQLGWVADAASGLAAKTAAGRAVAAEAAAAAAAAANASITMSNGKGEIVFHLYSTPLEGAKEDISLVWGLGKLVDGDAYTAHDPTYNVQGVYFNGYGRLRAVVSFRGSKIKLVWTKPGAGSVNEAGEATGSAKEAAAAAATGVPGHARHTRRKLVAGSNGEAVPSAGSLLPYPSFEVTWPDRRRVLLVDPGGASGGGAGVGGVSLAPASFSFRESAADLAADGDFGGSGGGGGGGGGRSGASGDSDSNGNFGVDSGEEGRDVWREESEEEGSSNVAQFATAAAAATVEMESWDSLAWHYSALLPPLARRLPAVAGAATAAGAAAAAGKAGGAKVDDNAAAALTAAAGAPSLSAAAAGGGGPAAAAAAAPAESWVPKAGTAAAAEKLAAAAAATAARLPVATWPAEARQQESQEGMVVPSVMQPIQAMAENGRDCVFLLDLQAGWLGEAGSPPQWVDIMTGELVGINCPWSANITVKSYRIDWDVVYPKAVNYSVLLTVVCLVQIALLFKQLHYSPTQAAAARVSLLCIGQQAVLDALLCIAHLLLCAMMQPLFVAFASIAFFKLIMFCVFEMRYIILIFQARQPQSFFDGGWAAMRREMAALHGRFYAALFVVLFSAYFLRSWFPVVVLLLHSFWVPQIVSNVIRETRQPLHRTYLLGMSASRLVVPLYVYGCPHSFLRLIYQSYRPNYAECVALVTWMAFQVAVLVAQDRYGPHFFIPKRFLPPKYDYHRPLPPSWGRSGRHGGGGGGANGAVAGASANGHSHVAAGAPASSSADGIGGSNGSGSAVAVAGTASSPPQQRRGASAAAAAAAAAGGTGRATAAAAADVDDLEMGTSPECAICYNAVDPSQEDYMMTPCDHVFHEGCLVRWMEIKMECPTCRATLPPA